MITMTERRATMSAALTNAPTYKGARPARQPVQRVTTAPQKLTAAPPRAAKPARALVSPRLDSPSRKAPRSLPQAPQAWAPTSSPLMRGLGYTMNTHDLQPGMSVSHWPAESSRTVASVDHLTKDNSQVTYTDGTGGMVSRNASFAHGIPTQ